MLKPKPGSLREALNSPSARSPFGGGVRGHRWLLSSIVWGSGAHSSKNVCSCQVCTACPCPPAYVLWYISLPASSPFKRRTLRMQTDERQASLPAALQEVALPRRLERLAELACNLWWTWHPSAQGVFKHIDPSLWDDTYHNPVKFLRQAPRKTLNAAVQNKAV